MFCLVGVYQYAYFDMDDTVEAALNLAKNELKKNYDLLFIKEL